MFHPSTFTSRLWLALKQGHQSHHILFWWPLIGVSAFLVCAVFFDRPTIGAMQLWPDHERAFFRWLTDFGKSDWILVPALIGLVAGAAMLRLPLTYSWQWAARGLQGLSGFVFLGVAIPGLVTVVLKRIIGRGRPLYMDEEGTLYFEPFEIIDWTVHSFPSGHATTALAFSIVLITLTGGRFGRTIMAIGLGIGLSRIVIADHFLSDVLAGIGVGLLVAVMVRDYFITRNWGIRIENGRVRFRYFVAFAPLWRRLQRRHVPRLVK